MAHPASYYRDMAEIDAQIAEAQFAIASGKTATTPEEIQQQQLELLRAQKAGTKADLDLASANKRVSDQFKNLGSGIKRGGYNFNRSLANVPTPGGIGVPLFLLLFLYFILFPIPSVGGKTRMMWLLYVIAGYATINVNFNSSAAVQPVGNLNSNNGLTAITPTNNNNTTGTVNLNSLNISSFLNSYNALEQL